MPSDVYAVTDHNMK